MFQENLKLLNYSNALICMHFLMVWTVIYLVFLIQINLYCFGQVATSIDFAQFAVNFLNLPNFCQQFDVLREKRNVIMLYILTIKTWGRHSYSQCYLCDIWLINCPDTNNCSGQSIWSGWKRILNILLSNIVCR